jgi:LmbE family N-acetylglucosaminyl deacetylase
MAVHAHPDDEATGTGGVLARYAAEGIRTVLVTCTDGGCGDGPEGVKPGDPGHDPAAVALMRRQELQASCDVLKVSDLEMLDYADSGMMGWPSNDAPGSFWQTPVEVGAARLAELMRHYRPDVVVTYDENGFYGHPDHIQTHRITMAALEMTALSPKVYWTTMPRSMMRRFGEIMREFGEDMPEPDPAEAAALAEIGLHVGGHHRVQWSEVRRVGRARQSGREHLLPQDGQGEVRRVDGHGDLRTCPGRHWRGRT